MTGGGTGVGNVGSMDAPLFYSAVAVNRKKKLLPKKKVKTMDSIISELIGDEINEASIIPYGAEKVDVEQLEKEAAEQEDEHTSGGNKICQEIDITTKTNLIPVKCALVAPYATPDGESRFSYSDIPGTLAQYNVGGVIQLKTKDPVLNLLTGNKPLPAENKQPNGEQIDLNLKAPEVGANESLKYLNVRYTPITNPALTGNIDPKTLSKLSIVENTEAGIIGASKAAKALNAGEGSQREPIINKDAAKIAANAMRNLFGG